MADPAAQGLLRLRSHTHDDAKVGYVELFFDLVFVFAVTQLSHGLLAHLTPLGAIHTAMLLLAVWWVWIYTAWVTNWLDVERMAVRLLLFALMGLGLLMSLSIPQAFDARGMVFVTAFLTIQIARPAFMLAALRGRSPDNYRNFQRILIWALLSAPLWIAGALVEGHGRTLWWAAALAIDYAGPLLGFLVPGLGRTLTGTWNVEGHHLAERCGLFVIIALGESVLITGATFAEVPWNGAEIAGFASAFLGTVAMWWIYFNVGAVRGSDRIAHHDDPGRMARLAYTYLHLPIAAGIIVTAAADELVLAHPVGHAAGMAIAAILGGPALYLLGNMAFKRTTAAHFPLSHMVGLAMIGGLALVAGHMEPVALSVATTAILLLVAAWETLSFRRGAA
ncbi:MAG: low temperature requirement protein A [Sphingobium sp.]